MKKIVALVLSLVMVLGLATTAFAAPTVDTSDATWTALEGKYDVKDVDETGATLYMDSASLYASDAKAPKDTDKPADGKVDEYGWVKAFSAQAKVFVQVPALADADYVVYYEDSKTVFAYVVELGAEADMYYLGTPVAFTNFGDECGQLDEEPAADTDYYFFEGVVYEEATWATKTEVLMVGNELTPVKYFKNAGDFVAHTAVYTYDKDYKVVAIECSECGCVANIVKNYMSLPKANQVAGMYFNVNGTECAYWTTAKAPAADATDKVESAETFDAGIAMYVGMSVMAAAGSAVVLKKKD